MIKSIITFILIVASCASANASDDIELLVLRSKHELIVKQNGNILRTFKVAFGSGGRKAKLRLGDHTTPKGQYYISKMKDSDRFHLFFQISYPNLDDAKRALKTHLITREEYRSILDAQLAGKLPPQNTDLGGAIGIHGIGVETKNKLAIHEVADWTQGCIAMRNDYIEELGRYINVGTPINIVD